MPLGQLWGALFFVFMTFASFSTVTAVFENLIACSIDNFGWNRKKAVLVNLIIISCAAFPVSLGTMFLQTCISSAAVTCWTAKISW